MADFTIIDVFRELDLAPEPRATWSAGAQLREAYLKETGRLPPKDNRQKTSGAGSHCFAIYPDGWRAKALEIVKTHQTKPNPQIDMFKEPATDG